MNTVLLQTLAAKIHSTLYGELPPHARRESTALLSDKTADPMVAEPDHTQPEPAQEVQGGVSCPYPPHGVHATTADTNTCIGGVFPRSEKLLKNSP